jgi:small subunit ribosomal protein S1
MEPITARSPVRLGFLTCYLLIKPIMAAKPAAPSFSMEDFMAALDEKTVSFEAGQRVKGKPFEYANDGVYVDIGGKSAAFLPVREAAMREPSGAEELQNLLPPNVEREFIVLKEANADGQVTISIRQMVLDQAWKELAKAQEEKQAIAARVNGVNKGGVTAAVMGLRGFIPRSHLVEREDLDSLVGQTLTVVPIEVNRNAKKLVLSNREAAKVGLMARLKVNQLIEGKITGIRPFGVFVSFEGNTGLLHVKQMSQAHVASIEDLFSQGERIRAVIMEIDEWKGRIALSTAVLENHRGEMLENKATVMTEAIARHAQLYPHWDAEPEPIAESNPEPTKQPTTPEAADSIAPTDSTDSTESTAAQANPEAIAPETPDNPAAPEPATKPEPAPAPKAPIRLVDLKPKPSRAPESDA